MYILNRTLNFQQALGLSLKSRSFKQTDNIDQWRRYNGLQRETNAKLWTQTESDLENMREAYNF